MHPFPLTTLVARVRAWPVDSQRGARRNAMVASTKLAARRAEREDVDAFFDSLSPRERERTVAARR